MVTLPTKKSPIVKIQESSELLTLAESDAIVEYLMERFGKGKLIMPADAKSGKERALYLYWLHFAEVRWQLSHYQSIF